MVVIVLIFKTLVFAQQLFAKDSYTECDKNPSDSLVTDTRPWMDSLHLNVFFKIYCKDRMHSMFKDMLQNCSLKQFEFWSQWPRGLRHRSTVACLLRLWVRIPPGAWMSVCCECCVLSGRGLCDTLITRQEESYRL